MSVVITLPQYDDTTGYLFAYSHEIVNFAHERGKDIIELKRPRLRRAIFESILHKKNPSFVCFNGHGDERTIYGDKIGNDAEFLVKLDENSNILNGKVVYARSCWAAKELGQAYAEGPGCFIGYDCPFVFWVDDTRVAKPLTDETARYFLDPTNELIKAILKGNSAEESAEKFKEQSIKGMMKILRNKQEPGAINNLRALWMNLNHIKVIGNKAISI